MLSKFIIFVLFTFSSVSISFPHVIHHIINELKKLNVTSENKVECLHVENHFAISSYSECCKVYNEHDSMTIVCMPTFIIGGTQKSGTTVLSAMLSNHPKIIFPRAKETHFFDKDKLFRQGKYRYLEFFRPWNFTHADLYEPPIYGEATPFYIASRSACSRLSNAIPNIKILVLMREPVARAYSEYNMKKRSCCSLQYSF